MAITQSGILYCHPGITQPSIMTAPMTEEQVLGWLDRGATRFKPRMFAVYGVSRLTGNPFLGWGIDFGEDEGGALYIDPEDGGTVQGASAEGVLGLHRHLGEARLKWLDDAEPPAPQRDQGATT